MLRKLKTKLIDAFKNRYCKESSFSQDSEDEILEKIFLGKNDGFFVDIGAHHPKVYSNTYKFYLKGWSGVNIDPRPGIMDEFEKLRPRDVNLELGIAEEKGETDFYIFDAPAVSTFDRETAYGRNVINGFKHIETRKIKTDLLINIFDKYIGDKIIDFLSIDVEGLEFIILKQNDWQKYRPKVIVCEMLFTNVADNTNPIMSNSGSQFWSLIENLKYFDIHNLLIANGYGILSKGVASVIYVDKTAKW